LIAKLGDAQLLEEFRFDRLPRFGAQALHAFVGIVARERRQVHAADGAEEPGDLPIFFHRPARDQGGSAAFDSGGIHADGFDPVEIERGAPVRMKWPASEGGDGAVARKGMPPARSASRRD
jgi:hypothetical protein